MKSSLMNNDPYLKKKKHQNIHALLYIQDMEISVFL